LSGRRGDRRGFGRDIGKTENGKRRKRINGNTEKRRNEEREEGERRKHRLTFISGSKRRDEANCDN
jgi:hypothetical protein